MNNCIICNNPIEVGHVIHRECLADMDEATSYMNKLSIIIEERAVEAANFIINNNSTVREVAKELGVSKSTAHLDVTSRLAKINPKLAEEVKQVLAVNKLERHVRGGQATKEKYMHSIAP